MSEPSLPQGSLELPSLFSFTLPYAEVTAVHEYAQRYAPATPAAYRIHVAFLPGKHQWFMGEANLTAWFEYDGDGPQAGQLTLPHHVFKLMASMSDDEDVVLRIDRAANTVQFDIDGVNTTVDLPPQTSYVWNSAFASAWNLRAETSHMVKLGRVMLSQPVVLPMEELDGVPLPFIDFSFNGDTLTAVRDWTRFGGPRVTVDIPASGAFRGEFSCFADPIARELFYADLSDGDDITIAFSLDTPNIAHITGDRWGIKTELGHHYVFEHRFNVVENIAAEDIEVQEDSRIGWDAVVRCTHREQEVTATILCGEDNEAHFVRLACVVVADAPWNLQMAEEMNSWNNMWANSKLVREGDHLLVIADVPVTSLEVLDDAVRDLVKKATNVRDVVAVFM